MSALIVDGKICPDIVNHKMTNNTCQSCKWWEQTRRTVWGVCASEQYHKYTLPIYFYPNYHKNSGCIFHEVKDE